MATIYDVTLTPGKDDLVTAWMGGQRWYAAKGRTPRLRRLDSWRLDDPAGEVGIETIIFLDEAGPEPTIYQVPLTYRGAPLEGGEAALVGELEHPVLGHRWVYDGPHDPVYAAQLLALIDGRAEAQHGSRSDTPDLDIAGAPHPAWTVPWTLRETRVLTGEQSNTSIIYDLTDDEGSHRPVIAKVFRTLSPGENPDVVIQGALAAWHSPFIPATVGHVAGAWERPDGTTRDHGHLVFAQEFLPGAADAWRVALDLAAAGTDFTERAFALGVATAEVHSALARALPTEDASAERIADIVAGMRHRLALATNEVPALNTVVPAARELHAMLSDLPWPPMQRIHGDYHLGQVLDVPDRGWVLIDFEGEPLRSLAERNRLDSPLRDIAGMLRSFDYVGGSLARGARPVDASAWVEAARAAFLDGYASVGQDPRLAYPELLRAFEVDKALYEVIYEARNRPTWLPIPTTAITRLLEEVAP